MKYFIFLLLLIVIHVTTFGQCDGYIVTGSEVFHANGIRTVINSGGDMFWDLGEAKFQVPYNGLHSPTAIYAAAVWIGAFDDVGALKVAAQTFRNHSSTTQEYLAGPLTAGGILFDTDCTHWDTIWSVARYEVLQHIADFNDNGIIDNPQKSIFGWPGRRNVNFESINGFGMPDTPRFGAPFFDLDGDGEYEPQDGEYPCKEHASGVVIPDQLTWHVFNDKRLHHVSQGDPLGVEIQQVCYAFYCTEDPALNNTMFTDFYITNRNTHPLDSVYFGMWMDPDLGCYEDDYTGCVPEQNAFMVYNADAIDGPDCAYPYEEGPPVLSACFTNKEMSGFMYYVSGSFGTWPHGMTDPQSGSPIDFYRLMTGSWIDGRPLTLGGSGYNPGSSEATTFAYPGDPNDNLTWAMSNMSPPLADIRVVASTRLRGVYLFDPGDTDTVSMAFTLHRDPQKNNLENVSLMYEKLPVIRQKYGSGFSECVQDILCTSDCVWPGDANHDGIANNLDLLALGNAYGRTGVVRNGPLTWAPHSATQWSDNFLNGANMKHADANGDGTIDYVEDPGILEDQYGNTHDGYQPVFQCIEGEGIEIKGGFSLFDPSNFQTLTEIVLHADIVGTLNGLAFTVSYDTAYFRNATILSKRTPFEGESSAIITHNSPGVVDYATTKTNGTDALLTEDKSLLTFALSIKNNDVIPGQNDTTQVCVGNIRAVLSDGTEIPLGSNTIEFVFLETPTALPAELSESRVSVYPNPSTGRVTLEVSDRLVGASFSVVDATGREIRNGNFESTHSELELAAGVSFLVIHTDTERLVQKVVVLE